MKKTNLFYRIVAATLVLVTGLFGFVAAGAQTMALRDYDATIGLLSRPEKTFSGLAKLFQPIEAEAQTVFCTNCVNEATFNIEKILNKLLRDIVLAFVKSFINFLQQQFDKLLQIVEQWANTILGIQLNLSSIRKFVALQSVKLYNQIEGSVNEFFDEALGPLEEKVGIEAKRRMTQSLSAAATTGEISAGVAEACKINPGQCASNPPPNPDTINQTITQTFEELVIQSCLTKPSNSNTDDSAIAAAVKVSQRAFIDPTCFKGVQILFAINEKLNARNEGVRAIVREAAKDENLKPGNPNSCAPFLETDANLRQTKNQFGDFTGGNFSGVADFSVSGGFSDPNTTLATSIFSNDTLDNLNEVTFGTSLRSLSQAECDLANNVELNKFKLSEGTKAKNAPQSEDLGAVLQQTLLDFVDSIFKALEQVITKILDAAFSAIANAISNIGIREISGPLSEAFNKTRSGINGSVSQALRDARNSVRDAIIN